MRPSGLIAAVACSSVRPGAGVRSRGRGSEVGYGSAPTAGAAAADPPSSVALVEREQVRLVGAEVVVPVAHGVALVQDRVDLQVGARLPRHGVGLERAGSGQQRRLQDHRVRVARDGRDAVHPAGEAGQRAGLAAGGREDPELGRLVPVGVVGVGPGGDEEEVAGCGEGRAALALRRAGEAPRHAAARRGHDPEGVAVAGPRGVEGRDGEHRAASVGREHEAAEARDGDELVEVGEGGAGVGHAPTLAAARDRRRPTGPPRPASRPVACRPSAGSFGPKSLGPSR